FLCALPAHAPGNKGALPGIAFQDPLHARSDVAIVLRKFRHGLVIPFVQILRSPSERLIKMAKIASVRPSMGNALLHSRRRNLVATHRVQQSEGSARHVAVVTTAAG